jgi:NADH-quinone oxidoreductase subunit E
MSAPQDRNAKGAAAMSASLDPQPLAESVVDGIIAQFPDRTGDVLGILEALQEAHPLKFLPMATLDGVARRTGISRSQIFGVVTFYAFFNLEPQGRHAVTVCRGTACHTRGSKHLLDGLHRALGLHPPAEAEGAAPACTTPDYRLTVRTVACFGQCALAPVVTVDHAIYGNMTDLKLRKLVAGVEGGHTP